MRALVSCALSAGASARDHRDAVLATLALAHEDLAAREIEILHAQPHAFHEAHARAIEEPRHQARNAVEQCKNVTDFLACQHDRQPPRPFGAFDFPEPGQLDAEHLPVEEQECRQRWPRLLGQDFRFLK